MSWSLAAKFLSRPKVVDKLIDRALLTPYTHIRSYDDKTVYMYRFWLFNPYLATAVKVALQEAGKKIPWKFPISVRLHRIMRPDSDRDLHDHPWNARTIVLRGWYREVRLRNPGDPTRIGLTTFLRSAGDTATLNFNEYHRITEISEGGVWTLFITYKYRGVWGFLVNGVKVPFYEYLKGRTPE